MTREEQILKACDALDGDAQGSFICGAEWADQNPHKEEITLEQALTLGVCRSLAIKESQEYRDACAKFQKALAELIASDIKSSLSES